MKTAINNNICAAVALLNNYNWFNVVAEAPNGDKTTFKSTGICFNRGALEFNRQFAAPTYTSIITEVAAMAENKLSFLTDCGTLYIVEGQHNATLADRQDANGSLDNPASLIDWSRSRIDEAGKVVLVLDFGKAGILSRQQAFSIRNYMNIFLGGLSRSKQVCRTIYITADQQTTIGLYNLETEQPMTAINALETSFMAAEAAQLNRLIDAVKGELEIVPLF